ncbi:MAG: glycosyltransferase family 4 protein [Nonlabens sp.]|nr:glycosyltransferase family 4 protein [Nonlabens sp.]
MNIALFSPNKNPYSETFIQAHKELLPGKVHYYYGDKKGLWLENHKVNLVAKTALDIFKKKFSKSNDFKKWNRLKKSVKANSIDVILVEYGNHAHELLPLLTSLEIPFVVHFHGYDATVDYVLKQTSNYRQVFETAAAIIAVSKVMYDKLINLGCPENKLHYNVYGPSDHFSMLTANISKPQFIAVGRFTDKKAPYFTILAFAKAQKAFQDATLVMVGNGALLDTCMNLVSYLKLEESVIFAGVKTPQEVSDLMSSSRAFVQHSITAQNGDQEGTPLSVLEASATGIPVIATRHAGISDVVQHGVTGLLCDECDVDTMATHMIELLEQPDKAKAMGTQGKERIKTHFSMDRHIDALYEILTAARG